MKSIFNKTLKVVFVTLVLSSTAHAQTLKTLIISDVDDTIKISHVRDTLGKIGSAFDVDRVFMGMAPLYHFLQNQNTEMVYLSAAPDWLMRNSHTELLKTGGFPNGMLILRNGEDKSVYKIQKIRELIKKSNPSVVYLFGDDGEQDGAIYQQVIKENPNRFVVAWIHNVYAEPVVRFNYSERLRPYATPVEIAADMLVLKAIDLEQFNNLTKFVLQVMKTDNTREEGPQVIASWAVCPVVRKFPRPHMNSALLIETTRSCYRQ